MKIFILSLALMCTPLVATQPVSATSSQTVSTRIHKGMTSLRYKCVYCHKIYKNLPIYLDHMKVCPPRTSSRSSTRNLKKKTGGLYVPGLLFWCNKCRVGLDGIEAYLAHWTGDKAHVVEDTPSTSSTGK